MEQRCFVVVLSGQQEQPIVRSTMMQPEKRTQGLSASEELLKLMQEPGEIRSKAARASKLAEQVHEELRQRGITK